MRSATRRIASVDIAGALRFAKSILEEPAGMTPDVRSGGGSPSWLPIAAQDVNLGKFRARAIEPSTRTAVPLQGVVQTNLVRVPQVASMRSLPLLGMLLAQTSEMFSPSIIRDHLGIFQS